MTLALAEGPSVAFSGHLGRPYHPLLRPPEPLDAVDWVVVESTYGDRIHDDAGAIEHLADAIRRTVRRGGVVIIPAFAVDRTEVILYHLGKLAAAGAFPDVPVFVDSPMALTTLGVYRDALAAADLDVRPELASGPDPFDAGHVVEVRDVEESKALNGRRDPAIIVSASGMATGGRVVHHLAHRLPDFNNTVVLVRFQAEGTRGRALADGARSIKLLGRYVPVRADVVDLPVFSVHADRTELVDWLRTAVVVPCACGHLRRGTQDHEFSLGHLADI